MVDISDMAYIKFYFCIITVNIWTIAGTIQEGACTDKSCGQDPVFLGNFHIPTVPVPRLALTDPRAQGRLQDNLPVILTDTNMFTTEEPWSFEYLARVFKKSEWKWQVFNATSRRFLYYGNDINYANWKWSPSYSSKYMTFSQFVDLYREIEKAANSSRAYMQTGFYDESTADAKYHLNTTVLTQIGEASKRFAPGSTHWFYVGMKDVFTSMHYDYNDHMVAQIYGHKRCTILNPDQYGNMYPYPMSSPLDRNSRVDLENPDYVRFPKFKNVKGFEAILRPGDVLYVPAFWWHLVESEHNSETVSLSCDQHSRDTKFLNRFGYDQTVHFKPQKDGSVVYKSKEDYVNYEKYLRRIFDKKEDDVPYFSKPDSASRRVHVRRMVEQMITDSVGNYREVGPILKELYEGRFDDLEFDDE